MKKKILLQDLANHIAKADSIPVKTAEAFVRAFFNAIEQGLVNDNFVKIKGFGTFKIVAVSERESVNINTGERIQINGHTKVTFTPDASLKELVNKPFAHFEAVDLNDGTAAEEFEDIDKRMAAEETAEEAEEQEDLAPADSLDSYEEAEAEGERARADDEDDSEPTQYGQAATETTEEETTEHDASLPHLPPADTALPASAEPQPAASHEEQPAPNDGNEGPQPELPADDTTTPPDTDNVREEELQEAYTESAADTSERLSEKAVGTTAESAPLSQDLPHEAPCAQPSEPVDGHEESESTASSPAPSAEQGRQSATYESASQSITYTYREDLSPKRKCPWKKLLLALLLICLMAGCYFAGYFRLFCPCALPHWPIEKKQAPPTPAAVQETRPRSQVQATRETNPERTASLRPDNTKQLPKDTTVTRATQPAKAVGPRSEASTPKQTQTAPQQPAQKEPRTYVVRKGDNLSRIARKYYGSDKYVPFILRHNKLKDADCIHAGTRLELPPR